MPRREPAEPWRSLLGEVDRAADGDIELHCIGGFVLEAAFGLSRTTGDLDFLSVAPPDEAGFIERLAGRNSPLHKKYKVYLQHVTVLAAWPEDYEQRLIELFPRCFSHLRLFALEPHDLALTKLERNWELDRSDLVLMAKAGLIDAAILRERYYREMRPYLGSPDRHDLTIELWVEIVSNCVRSA